MVDDAHTVTARLEADLGARGCQAEVINGGTVGYSTDQEYLFFRDEGRKYAPDVVILGPLTKLAGYRIYYGLSRDSLAHVITVANPGISRYVVSGLLTATWYFQMTAYDRNGMESPPTAVESILMR